MFKVKKIHIYSPYSSQPTTYPNFYQRIQKVEKTGLINMIIIDGKSQTGKSTLARKICMNYDQEYITVFTVEDLIKKLRILKEKYNPEVKQKYKWIFFDEPELEAPKGRWWDKRNEVLQMVLSSYGFLKLNIIMALPNVKGLSDTILTNLSLRISMRVELDKYDHIVRKAFIKKSSYNENKQKFFWTTVQVHTVEDIERDMDYENAKAHNFFNVQLPKWEKRFKETEEERWTSTINKTTGDRLDVRSNINNNIN